MASCVSKITNLIANNLLNTIPNIEANTRTAFSITPLNSIVYRLSTNKNENINFIVELATTLTIKATLTFFTFNETNNTFTAIGSINLTESYNIFQKVLDIGEYFICIKVNNNASYTGFITGNYSSFIPYAKLTLNNYYGFYSETNLEKTVKILPCDYPLWYDIIEGELPEGITFDHSGMLKGLLPNLDCMQDNYNLSPSANWYGELTTGESHPWGRSWRFKIRVYVQEFPNYAIAEKWLCIKVYNNWDLEKNALLNSLPLQQSYEIIVEPDPIVLPKSLCPEVCDLQPILPEPIVEPCLDCPEDINTSIQLIRIPSTLEIDVDNFMIWWIENNSNEFITREEQYFITSLKSSTIFNLLLKKVGITKTTIINTELQNSRILLTRVNDFIELRLSVQKNNRNITDIDTAYLNSKQEVNNVLEFELIAYFEPYSSTITFK